MGGPGKPDQGNKREREQHRGFLGALWVRDLFQSGKQVEAKMDSQESPWLDMLRCDTSFNKNKRRKI